MFVRARVDEGRKNEQRPNANHQRTLPEGEGERRIQHHGGKRRLRWGYLLSAALAVIGAAIIRYDKVSDHFWTGLMFVQLANISFAIGMVGYKRLMETRPMPQHNAFAWFYMGAAVVAVAAWFMLGNPQKMPTTSVQWGVLVWLGVVASGLGYLAGRRRARHPHPVGRREFPGEPGAGAGALRPGES
jgi:peptidoglycan/LPS O-acetylase OafA/YrhL